MNSLVHLYTRFSRVEFDFYLLINTVHSDHVYELEAALARTDEATSSCLKRSFRRRKRAYKIYSAQRRRTFSEKLQRDDSVVRQIMQLVRAICMEFHKDDRLYEKLIKFFQYAMRRTLRGILQTF